MNKVPQHFKDRYEAEIEQLLSSNHETIRAKFQKKKVSMATLCTKKDLHFIINSMLQGDIFEEDIFNEFWDSHFRQTATISEVVKAYNYGIIHILKKIVDNNMRIHELTKQKEKHQKDHNFKYITLTGQQLESLTLDNNQYINDLDEICKPFGLNYASFISKYKPYRLKERTTTNQQIQPKLESEPENIFLEIQKEQKKIEVIHKQTEKDTPTEQKYYRFCIYLTIFVTIVDLSLSYTKFNFIDLLVDLLLLLNALFQNYIAYGDQFTHYYSYIGVDYEQNKIAIFDTMARDNNFKYGTITTPYIHSYERHTYSSMWILIVAIIFDLIWVIFIRPYYYLTAGQSRDPFLLSIGLGRYNQYVAGASLFILIIKVIILLALTMTINFEFKKFISRYNILFSCLRFTSQTYINQLMVDNNNS